MENKIKIYKSSKDLPFLNYKRIIQTGDFLYMVRGYEDGDEVEADLTELEKKFNDLLQEFVLSVNAASEEVSNHANYIMANLEFNKLTVIVGVIDILIKANDSLIALEANSELEECRSIVKELLEGVKVERSPDLNIQKEKLLQKLKVYENNIAKYKEMIEKDSPEDSENDIDKHFINVCLGLEIPFPDESKISLYQFALMTDRVIEKSKALEKINSK